MLIRFLTLILTIAYPFIIWWGLDVFGLVFLVGFMVALSALRYIGDPKPLTLAIMLMCILLGGVGCVYEDPVALKLYPVLMNLMMFFLFGTSLLDQESIIERFARLQNPELPDKAIAYTRHLTVIWCAFFIVNGGIALWTVLCASDQVWAIYNGAVAYALMGCLFVGEWLYRKFILKI